MRSWPSLRERGVAIIYITHRLGEVRGHRRSRGRAARRRQCRRARARGADARQHDRADGRPRHRRRARAQRTAETTASTSGSTGCGPGATRSTPCRSPSPAARSSDWPAWSAPDGRRWRWRSSASNRRWPARSAWPARRCDHGPAGRHRPRPVPRAGGSPGRGPGGGVLDSRERVAAGARPLREARARVRSAGAPAP